MRFQRPDPGRCSKQQIPVHGFNEWTESKPGFMEADLVAHGGTPTNGSFLWTLTLTDIAIGRTECFPLLNQAQERLCAFERTAVPAFSFARP